MLDHTSDGRAFRLLNVLDEYTRAGLAIRVARRFTATDVQECLSELFCQHGVPKHLRSDNGPEFGSAHVRTWVAELGSQPLFIEPASPWENGYQESFNGKLRDELLNGEMFDTVLEAQVLTAAWRHQYNHVRPHSALGYRPPAPETVYAVPITVPLFLGAA
jgi:putative transposase